MTSPPDAAVIPPLRRPRDLRCVESSVLLLLLVASLLLFVLLPERPLVSQGVYIDEHSLMPMSHNPTMQLEETAQAVDSSERRMREAISSGGAAGAHTYLRQQMKGMGLQVGEYVHHHDDSPLQPLQHERVQPTSSMNVTSSASTVVTYGVWRAPRSDGKECVVLLAELEASQLAGAPIPSDPSISGVAMLMTLMAHLSHTHGHLYYARDVILVVVERGERGSPDTASRYWSRQRAVDAFGGWVRAYHSAEPPLMLRAGRILTTLVLDVPLQRAGAGASHYRSLSLDAVGFHGLMPNLDLPSLLLRMFASYQVPLVVGEGALRNEDEPEPREAVTHSYLPSFLRKDFFSSVTPNERPSVTNLDPYGVLNPALHAVLGPSLPFGNRWHLWDTNLARWKGLWRFMLQALQGGAGQYHAHANSQAIDALTLGAVEQQQGQGAAMSAQEKRTLAAKILRALETSLRSVNNASEKLHHSTWWYLLNHSLDFVTMSKYIYMAVLPLGSFALLALSRLSSQLGGLSPSIQAAAVQRIAHSAGMVGAIYAITSAQYASVDMFIAVVGGGHWNETAMHAWCASVCVSWLLFFLLAVPRFSQLDAAPRSRSDGTAPVTLLTPRQLAEEGAKAEIIAKEKSKRAGSAVVGLELPLSPAGLPLLVPSHLSPSTPAPVYTASFDWRTFHALLLAGIIASLAPVMVLNTSVCALTLLFVAPLVFLARTHQWPFTWMRAFKAMRDVHGRPLRLGLAGNSLWQFVRFLVGLVLHVASLLLCSPATMLLLYAHFHSLSLHSAVYTILHALARSPVNTMFVTFFFAYVPAFVGSLLLLACRFRMHQQGQQQRVDKKEQ